MGICSWVADTKPAVTPAGTAPQARGHMGGTQRPQGVLTCRAPMVSSGQEHGAPGSCPWAARMRQEAQLHLRQTGCPPLKPKLPQAPIGVQGPGNGPST